MAELRSVKIASAWRGQNSASAPTYVPDGQGTDLRNVLPGTPGVLPRRGGVRGSTTNYGNAVSSPGAWTKAGSAVFWAGEAGPLLSRATVPDGTAQASFAVASSVYYPSGHGADLLNGVYGRGSTGTILQWNGTTTMTAHTVNAPLNVTHTIGHLQRLFALGGSVPGGAATVLPKNLYYSDPGGPTTDLLTYWQDDYSGLVNQIVVPIDDSDTPTGLGRVGQNLAIFCRNSIYVLYGQTPATFSVRRVVSGIGCSDPRSIVTHNDAVYFMSDSGFARFDGAEATVLSDDVANYAGFRQPTTCLATTLPGNSLLVVPDGTAWIYHVPSGTWAEQRFIAADGTALQFAENAAGEAFAFNGYRVLDLSAVTNPSATPYGADVIGTTYAAVQPFVTTRTVRLASPEQDCQLNRVHFEYRLLPMAGNPDNARFEVDVYGDGGVLASATLPAATDGSTQFTGPLQTVSVDCFRETRTVRVSSVLVRNAATTDPGIGLAELNDIVLEYQVAKRRT